MGESVGHNGPMATSRKLIALSSALTAGVVALSLAACADTRPSAEEAARTLAAGLAARDVSESAFTSASAADVTAELAAITKALEPLAPAVTVSAVEETTDDAATATLDFRWDLDESDADWTYSTAAQLLRVEDQWQVTWEPSIVVDGLANGEVLASAVVDAERAEILGADGDVLVTARPVLQVGLDKTRLETDELDAAARDMAALVDIDADQYADQVAGAGVDAFVVAIVLREDGSRTITDEQINAIAGGLATPGTLELGPTRTFARELLGRVGEPTAETIAASDGELLAGQTTGLSGLQLQYNDLLDGTPGLTINAVTGPNTGTESDTAGGVARELFSREPVDGKPLATTLSVQLQSLAEEVLAGEPSAAAIVAIRPSSGAILAAANGPGSDGLQTALLGQYPPGSTFKVATSLALIRQGFTPETSTDCAVEVTVDGRRFNNASTYPAQFIGKIPLLQTFAQSCNTGFIAAREKISQQELAAAAADLGIGVETPIGLPAYFGSVPAQADGTAHAAAMIGQGQVLVSPLALATMAASVGAGERVAPSLLADSVPGSAIVGAAPEPGNLTAEEAATLRELMGAVVAEGGANLLADVPGEPVLAKTGTAEFGSDDPPRTHAWIIALQGDLAVAVFVEEGELGSTSGGPLMEAFLRGAAS